MKRKNNNGKVENREKGEKFQSRGSKIIVLLQQRTDVTRHMLQSLLGITDVQVDNALSQLRKKGYKIFPHKGPGTPLRIAEGQLNSTKYIAWRRNRFLPTAQRMVIAEYEIGEQYKELAHNPKELLHILNESTKLESTKLLKK